MISVGIIGSGRAGVGFGLALANAGVEVQLHGRQSKTLPSPLKMTAGGLPPWISSVDVVILAAPDDVLAKVAEQLAESSALSEKHVVLHLSGALDCKVLAPLVSHGCSLGSLHPLQSMSDPETTPQRLRGAAAAIEGDNRAMVQAEALARAVGLEPFRMTGANKGLYHAAAVFAANYLVVVAGTAARLIEDAGVPGEDAWRVLEPLIHGTLDNIRKNGPARALTGPIVRGDVDTVRKNLAVLSEEDASLYKALGRAALRLIGPTSDDHSRVESELSP